MEAKQNSSKYAGLPGIDTDSPDVFETPDQDETEELTKPNQEEFESENIESVPVDTQSAFSKFKGKYLDSYNADFSDQIGMQRRKGYETKGEYEILGDRSSTKETPGQKYQRLQHEMKELAEELEKLKNEAENKEKQSRLSSVALAKEVRHLQQQLQSWQLDTIIGPEFSTGSTIPQGTIQKNLQHQLESLKKTSKAKTTGSDQKNDCITYELLYKPEHAKLTQLSKVSDLEERVRKLERLLGPDSPHLSTLFDQSSSEEQSLSAAVANVQDKMAVLDTTHIEHIDARLQGILHHLNQLSSKQSELENVEKQKKISELYDLVSKWDATADAVPELICRLETLKSLHDQANQFGSSLTHLDSTQTSIANQLQTQQNLLNKVAQNFEANVASIGENCSKLDARISLLMKTFEKSGR